MSMDWNDPRLTAYALGELEGAELNEMEALVRESKEAREYVQSVRETANALSSELKSEPIPQRKPTPTSWWGLPVLNPYMSLAVAGVAAVMILLPTLREKLKEQSPVPDQATQMGKFREEADLALPDNGTPIVAGLADVEKQKAAPAKMAKQETATAADEIAAPDSAALPTESVAASPAVKRMGKGVGITVFGGSANGFVPGGFSEGQMAHNTENYASNPEADFQRVSEHQLSTFSIDVDTASYSVIRRYLNSNALPPTDAVRIEEMINYFPYSYAPPRDGKPVAVHVEQMDAPWKSEHKLVRIGLKAKDIDLRRRPKSNLVFLLDVSGSMNDANKLPLLKTSLRQMIENFNDNDRVAIVVYAGASGLVLPSTSNKNEIMAAIERLESGGSTNGGEGLELAYKVAQENFIPGGTNRVILATDGDFNVGTTSEGDLVQLIERKAQSKIFLTVLGFGSGNYKDAMMEKLADKGNGNYAYIDELKEAKKALVEQMGGTLITVAKDVKVQVEFNPKYASAYRLIGYENRKLNKEDFNNDAKDAGEMGAGHTVTALYEVVPAGKDIPTPTVDALKYAKTADDAKIDNDSKELLTVKVRYKLPEGDKSQLIEVPFLNEGKRGGSELKFAAAVAEFGMLLRDSKYKGNSSFQQVKSLSSSGFLRTSDAYRKEFVELVEKARKLKGKKP